MKKIVAVLVLALVAMTAVFAATLSGTGPQNDTINVKLTLGATTSFGFSSNQLTNKEDTITAPDTTEGFYVVRFNTQHNLYASYITNESKNIKVSVKIPTALKNVDNENLTIPVVVEDGNYTISYSEANDATVTKDGRRVKSVPVSFKIEADEGYLAGTYIADMTMTVTAE